MGTSMIDVQRNAILKGIREAGQGQWRILVVDEASRRLILNVLSEDDVLSENISHIEQLEERRQRSEDMGATYIVSPQPHIVDCVMADLERRRYRSASLLWTSVLHRSLRERIDGSRAARQNIQSMTTLDVGYWPKESQLITFRDPWSFPILYHPGCNHLVREHIAEVARKIVSICVSLGEYPTIRYFRPKTATHEASVLSSHLARFVQEEIDFYATYHDDFPPPSPRPRGILFIVDRSIDLFAPLLHEFTYQAMVHDLLPVKDGEKTTYKMTLNEGQPNQESKDVTITEKDKLWVANRHRHMKDTIDKLMGDFQKFLDENPHFADTAADNANSLSAIRDMLAGLPQFQEMKEAYSLHLTMAQEAMNVFQRCKLPDVASIEQTLATGFDEEHRKARGMADLVVRTLDEDAIGASDRLRLILLYLLHRDGLLPSDLERLVSHAQLAAQDGDVARNMGQLGAHITRQLKDPRPSYQSLFPPKPSPLSPQEEYSLSRFEPVVQQMLDEHCRGTLDQDIFPYTKPQLDATSPMESSAQLSLRSAKPTWATTRSASNLPKQRVIVFIAGGATYSEARACYETSAQKNKEVILATSHMLTPSLFMRQLGDLSVDHQRLGIPAEQPKQKAPAHLFEADPPAPAPQAPKRQQSIKVARPEPPTAQMDHLKLKNGNPNANNGSLSPNATASPSTSRPASSSGYGKEPEKKRKGLTNKLFGKK